MEGILFLIVRTAGEAEHEGDRSPTGVIYLPLEASEVTNEGGELPKACQEPYRGCQKMSGSTNPFLGKTEYKV